MVSPAKRTNYVITKSKKLITLVFCGLIIINILSFTVVILNIFFDITENTVSLPLLLEPSDETVWSLAHRYFDFFSSIWDWFGITENGIISVPQKRKQKHHLRRTTSDLCQHERVSSSPAHDKTIPSLSITSCLPGAVSYDLCRDDDKSPGFFPLRRLDPEGFG